MDPNWKPIPVSHAEWEDRFGDLFGYDEAKCPTCGAMIREGICLNACHLGPESKARFQLAMAELQAAAIRRMESEKS